MRRKQRDACDRGGGVLTGPIVDPGSGALLIPGRLAQEGVYEYIEGGKIVREYVTPAALIDLSRLALRAPLTRRHPPVPVTPTNAAEYVVGDLDHAEVLTEEMPEANGYRRTYVQASMAIRHQAAIDDVVSGAAIELSPRHTPRRRNKTGVHPVFGPFDRERIGCDAVNHTALVPAARGGEECSLDLGDAADAADAVDIGTPAPLPSSAPEVPMDPAAFLKLLLDALDNPEVKARLTACMPAQQGITMDALTKAVSDAVSPLMGRMDAAEGKLGSVAKEVEPLKAAADAARSASDAAEEVDLKGIANRFGVKGDSKAGLVAGLAERLGMSVDGLDAATTHRVVMGTAKRRLAQGHHLDITQRDVGQDADLPPTYTE